MNTRFQPTPASHGRCHGRAAAGFTLVEILVATTMLALLLGLLFATFHTAVRAWDRADRYSVEANDIEAVQRFIRNRLAAARPAVHPEDALGVLTPETRVTFVGARDHLAFVSPLPAFRSAGGLYLYVIRREGDQLLLHYRPFHPRMRSLQPAEDRPWSSQTLLTGVHEVRFRYLGQPHDDVAYGWHETWLNATATPALVEMRVSRLDPTDLHWPVLFVRSTAERTGGRGQTAVGFGGQ